ncbi:MAG: hypothetical protein WCD44_01860 [Candidatus Babeliales bacterium]
MKKIFILLFLASNWFTSLWSNNTLISGTLRRYGINSNIMKTREFKKPRRFSKTRIKQKNIKQKNVNVI